MTGDPIRNPELLIAELFYEPKTRMLFGDAKATLQKLITEVKAN